MNRNRLLPRIAFVTSFVLFTLAGCNPGDNAEQTKGTLRVLITDKPYPVDLLARAEVTITRVLVRRADLDDVDTNGEFEDIHGEDESDDEIEDELNDADDDGDAKAPRGVELANGVRAGRDASAADDGADDDHGGMAAVGSNGAASPFVEVFSGERTFDLLQLQNGQTDLLGLADIPAGLYTQMRIFVTEGEVELVDGRVFPLTVPSGAASGIKLHFEFEVESDRETLLLLDVDLSRAFTPIPGGRLSEAGQISNFHFSPSLAMRLIALVEAGSITGVVTDEAGAALASVLVTAYRGEDEVTGSATEADGAYTIIGLPAGDYRLEFSASGYADTVVEPVVVSAGEVADVGTTALAASGE